MTKKPAFYQLERDFRIVSQLRKKATGLSAIKLDKWLSRILEAAKPGNHTNKPDPLMVKLAKRLKKNETKMKKWFSDYKKKCA